MSKVFVNGTFDVLHLGHYSLLSYAKSLGDKLHVGIDCDLRVKELKGNTRPINTEMERKIALLALKAVDYVYIFKDNEGLEKLVQHVAPDIMVVGSDWEGKPVIGSQYAKQLKYFKRIDGYSTTQKIQHIIDRR